jgi:hypothetical protein
MTKADWSRLGLLGNPFENVLPGERLEWVAWPDGLEAALSKPPFAILLLGAERGAGKSTLLRACEARLRGQGLTCSFVYVPPDRRWSQGHPVESADVLLVDEADRMRPWHRWKVRRWRARGGSVLLGSHTPWALPGLTTFDLAAHPRRGWVEKRLAAHGMAALPSWLETWLPDFERAAGGVSYRLQRILYELFEALARGAACDEETAARAISDALEGMG